MTEETWKLSVLPKARRESVTDLRSLGRWGGWDLNLGWLRPSPAPRPQANCRRGARDRYPCLEACGRG